MTDEPTENQLLGTTMSVATWNLWWRFGPWQERHQAIESTLAALDADVVCLQEVWVDLTTGESSATRLAEALGMHHVVSNRADLDGTGFANAVLSRWPIVGHDRLDLWSPEEFEEHRLVLRADVDGPRGPIQVFTTHLHWRMDHSHIRCEQVRQITRFVSEAPKRSYPAVLCGDFNADPDSDEIRMLVGKAPVATPGLVFNDAWVVGGDGNGITWSNRNPYAAADLEPDRRIDYVFAGWPKAGGAGHVRHAAVFGDRPVEGVWPSDHFGVVATLRY